MGVGEFRPDGALVSKRLVSQAPAPGKAAGRLVIKPIKRLGNQLTPQVKYRPFFGRVR